MGDVVDIGEIKAEAMRQPGDDAEDEGGRAWQRRGVRTMAETLRAVYDRCRQETEQRRVSTCHRELDRLMGGFRPRRCTVVGAATSWGKSSYALMVTDEALRVGKRVLYVSAEDDEVTCGKRIAGRRAGVSAMRLRDEQITPEDESRLFSAVAAAEQTPWFLDGIGVGAERLAEAIFELCAEDPYDLVVVDYIQAIKAKAQDRRNEVSEVGRLLTDAIKRGDAAGLLLSQIRRLEDGKDPTKHTLKESGDIENAAEHILLGIEREGTDTRTGRPETKRYLRLAKNKDGPPQVEDAWLPFDATTASFREMS